MRYTASQAYQSRTLWKQMLVQSLLYYEAHRPASIRRDLSKMRCYPLRNFDAQIHFPQVRRFPVPGFYAGLPALTSARAASFFSFHVHLLG